MRWVADGLTNSAGSKRDGAALINPKVTMEPSLIQVGNLNRMGKVQLQKIPGASSG
jgi:hypothetical protein